MAAKKKTRRTSAKKATRKSTAKPTPKKVAGSKASSAKSGTARKGSPQAAEVVYSDLRKIALARALARR